METNSATVTDHAAVPGPARPNGTRAGAAPTAPGATDGSGSTGEWPVLPPVPTPTPPPPAHLGPEPHIRGTGGRDVRTFPGVAAGAAPVDPFESSTVPVPASAPLPARLFRVPLVSRPGAAVALRTRPVRRPIAVPSRSENQVWQPRFAYATAAVVTVAFVAVALPLFLSLYRLVGSPDAHPSGVIPLSMMLLGGFFSAVTAWVVIVEMRARVRMVDALGRTGEHEAPGTAGPGAVSGLLRPFIQVPAQVALLAVALSLFVGATIISF